MEKTHDNMKKNKPYPQMEEEDNSILNAKDAVGVDYADTTEEVKQDGIPGLPQTWDELMECIAEGEEEYDSGEAIPWEIATQRIKKHISHYGA